MELKKWEKVLPIGQLRFYGGSHSSTISKHWKETEQSGELFFSFGELDF